MEYLQDIAVTPLFHGIDPENLPGAIRGLGGATAAFKKGDPVEPTGVHDMGMVVRGRVMIVQNDYWGVRNIVHVLVTGKLLGESFTRFSGYNQNNQLIAGEDALILFFSRARLLGGEGLDDATRTRLLENLLDVFAIHQRVFLEKFQLLSKRRTRDKLMAYLSEQAMLHGGAAFTVSFSRQEMADYLCIERSAMCAELSRLQKDGYLRCDRKRFELLTPARETDEE